MGGDYHLEFDVWVRGGFAFGGGADLGFRICCWDENLNMGRMTQNLAVLLILVVLKLGTCH